VFITSLSDLQSGPALYALYGDDGRRYVAYVGAGEGLRRRVEAHLVRRDSAEAAGAQAVGINADHVREVAWWEHSRFVDDDALQAGLIMAGEVLEPALRSREHIRLKAREIFADAVFRAEMAALLRGEPTGRLLMPSQFEQWQLLERLAHRVAQLQTRLDELQDGQQNR